MAESQLLLLNCHCFLTSFKVPDFQDPKRCQKSPKSRNLTTFGDKFDLFFMKFWESQDLKSENCYYDGSESKRGVSINSMFLFLVFCKVFSSDFTFITSEMSPEIWDPVNFDDNSESFWRPGDTFLRYRVRIFKSDSEYQSCEIFSKFHHSYIYTPKMTI